MKDAGVDDDTGVAYSVQPWHDYVLEAEAAGEWVRVGIWCEECELPMDVVAAASESKLREILPERVASTCEIHAQASPECASQWSEPGLPPPPPPPGPAFAPPPPPRALPAVASEIYARDSSTGICVVAAEPRAGKRVLRCRSCGCEIGTVLAFAAGDVLNARVMAMAAAHAATSPRCAV